MAVSRDKLLRGVTAFAVKHVAPSIPDRAVQVMVIAAAKAAQQAPETAERLLHNPVVAMIMPSHDGLYEVESALQTLRDSVSDVGGLPLTISPIPLLLKEARELVFTAADIDALSRCIMEA